MDSEPQTSRETAFDEGGATTGAEDSRVMRQAGQRIRARLFGSEKELGRVGHFSLIRLLGAGGMGTVYEAFDERLQRRVALKFLRGVETERGEKRLFREAQGLARISHENVVPVYDVGRGDGRVWIAMEFVPGRTIGAWSGESDRSTDEILEHWLAAGRGLAAIHEAGLIHRDIKPANVLVGGDGRVRIIDFGLVKAADSLQDSLGRTGDLRVSDSGNASELSSSASLNESLTEADSFLGTPAYAAPEHWQRRWVDERSDQYSFCVSLWEALCAERPSRRDRGEHGLVRLPPGVRMSRRLHRALSRGLALHPDDRFPNMHALLAALEPPPRRWRIPVLTAALTTVVVGGLALRFMPKVEPSIEPADPCADAAAPVEGVWTTEHQRRLETELEPEVAASANRIIEDWIGDWSQAARTSCADVRIRGTYSEQALDRRSICLRRALDGFGAFVHALGGGSISAGQDASEWLSSLPDPGACTGEAVLLASYEAPAEEHAAEISALRQELLGVGVTAGPEERERIEIAKRIGARAEELGDLRLLGEASIMLGLGHARIYEFEQAQSAFGRALDIGTRMDDVELAAGAWAQIVWLEAMVRRDRERARWAFDRERAVFEDVEPSPRWRARLLNGEATVLVLGARYAEAEALLREALQIYEEIGPRVAWERATIMRQLANVSSRAGRGEQVVELYASARDLELQVDPRTQGKAPVANSEAGNVLDESIALVHAGAFGEARVSALAGLDKAIAEQGPRSGLVAQYHVVIAAACRSLADNDCVRSHAERADAISLLAYGPSDPRRVDVLSTVGVIALDDGRPEAALAAFEQALALAREHAGHDSVAVGLAKGNIADALRALGYYERGAEFAREALEILERELGPEHPNLGPVLVALAQNQIESAVPERARASLDRAAAIIPETDVDMHALIDELQARIDG